MISVIIPVYQVEKYIWQCLESVASQTYKDIEVIIVDDCGVDNSIRIVQEFICGYDGPIQFKIIRHDRNRGLSAARNSGLAIAQGEYISFIDSDDYVVPNAFEIMINYFKRSPTDVGIVMSGIFSDTEGTIADFYKTDTTVKIAPEEFADYMLGMRAPHCACAKLYKINVFDKVKFREGYRNEDILFDFDVYEYIESMGMVSLVIPERLYYYRQHGGSICHDNAFVLDEIENLEEIIEKVKDKKYSLSVELRARYLDLVVRAALDAKSQSSLIHKDYLSLCWKLKKIPDILAKNHFSRERYNRFRLLKHFPICYSVLYSFHNK